MVLRRFSIRSRFILLGFLTVINFLVGIVFVYITRMSLLSSGDPVNIEFYSHIRTFDTASIGFVLVVGSVCILTLLFLVSFMHSIINPLDDLHSSVTSFKVDQGFHLVLETSEAKYSDEIGVFSRTISSFLSSLSQTYTAMELKVSQRTEALTQRALHLQAAADLARETTNIADTQELLDRAVNLINSRFGLYFTGIYLLDANREMAILRAGTGEVGKLLIAENHHVRVGEIGLIGYVGSTGEMRIINDVQKDFVYRTNPFLTSTRSQAAFALKIGSETIGILDAHNSQENFFDTGITSVLQIMADQLTVALQNAGLVKDLRTSINDARLLYQRYAHDSWSRNRLGDLARGYQYDSLGVRREDIILAPNVLEKIQSGQPVIVDPENEEKTVLYMPLVMYNQVIGYIGLEDAIRGRQWTEDDMTVLETITSQIALALDNSRLLEETQLRADQINLLQEVTALAATKTNIVEILGSVAKMILQKLHLDYCEVLWIDPDGLSAASLFHDDGSARNSYDPQTVRFPVVGNPLFQHIFETRGSVELYDLLHNPLLIELRSLIDGRNLTALMVTPVILQEEISGFLLLQSNDIDYRFSIDDVKLMDQVSRQISSALEVAHSFEEANSRADRERKISLVTQRIRETLDIQTILYTATNELRHALNVPEVTIRLTQGLDEDGKSSQKAEKTEED